jgi:hypothetical protein
MFGIFLAEQMYIQQNLAKQQNKKHMSLSWQ